MNPITMAAVALASAVSIASVSGLRTTTTQAPLITQKMTSGQWLAVPRATVAQKYTRRIRITGPWMDYVAAVTPRNGVVARDLVRTDQQVEMTLEAIESAVRGDFNLSLIVACPTVPLTNGVVPGCSTSVLLPVRVFETGPIQSIQPNGTVPANAPVVFTLQGDGLGVAKLLPRLLRLSNAVILQQTATTMMVRGTTPSCGSVDVALTDKNDGTEYPYFHASTMQRVVAGAECGRTTVPKLVQCTPPQIWDAALQACRNP